VHRAERVAQAFERTPDWDVEVVRIATLSDVVGAPPWIIPPLAERPDMDSAGPASQRLLTAVV
jgi:hypothetical protein